MEIKIGNHTLISKNSWNELDLSELQMAYVILKSPDATPVIRLSELTKMLLNISDDFLGKWQEFYLNQDPVNGMEIWAEDWSKVVAAVTTPFVDLKEIENTEGVKKIAYQVSLSRTECPFPKITLSTKKGARNFYAAADEFSNMTIGEFARMDKYVENYLKTGEEKWITKSFAMIFRPHKEKTPFNVKTRYEGDVRVPMKEGLHTEILRATLIEQQMTEGARRMIWFWVVSCREQLYQRWKKVLNPVVEKRKNIWETELQKYGWAGLFIELATDGGITEGEVEAINCEDVFVKLAYLETKRKAIIEQNKP